jgi:acetyl-CoA decarbonylase/synthase complex subunit gamma
MAFAMKLAQKKVELSECPHASDEAKDSLGAASEPPIRLVKIGGANALEIGNETVMFRHDKTFFHQTGIATVLLTSEDIGDLRKKIEEIESYRVERVGEELFTDLFFIRHNTDKKDDFLETIHAVQNFSSKGLILDCSSIDILKKGLEICKSDRPAVYLREAATDQDFDLAKTFNTSLILTANSLESLETQSEKARAAGISDLILNVESENLGRRLQDNTVLRRSALKNNFKPFGFPLFSYIRGATVYDSLAEASVLMCKYDSIIVVAEYSKALLFALFTLRQNIYTDPQKPIQVDPKIYSIGDPTPDSPVFVTTNFSLTYFMVSGEIENSGISAHLVIADVEGQSVLTSWAAGKFVGETIAKFIKDIGLEDKVNTRKIVIPGFVSQISGDLEESLPGWEVIVGPQEASDIPSFVKNVKLT